MYHFRVLGGLGAGASTGDVVGDGEVVEGVFEGLGVELSPDYLGEFGVVEGFCGWGVDFGPVFYLCFGID